MDTEPLKRFLARVKTAAQTGAKEVRFPVGEANEVAACLAELLLELRDGPPVVEETLTVSFDGGSLKK